MDGGIGPAGMQSGGSQIDPRSYEVSRLVIVRLFSFLWPSVALHRKVGPGDVFLITIPDGFQEPVHFCFRPADTTLPKLEDSPSLLEQFGSVPKVSFHILVEFQSPEFFASSRGCGISAARVSVPKTAMNENADVVARKHHVWPTWKFSRMQSIPESVPV
jgi:hypothetical protein